MRCLTLLRWPSSASHSIRPPAELHNSHPADEAQCREACVLNTGAGRENCAHPMLIPAKLQHLLQHGVEQHTPPGSDDDRQCSRGRLQQALFDTLIHDPRDCTAGGDV